MDNLLEIGNLGKRYPGTSQWALKDVSLSFRRGEVYGLMGENGAGKTTLLRIILGFLRPTTGQVISQSNLRLGYVSERPAFYPAFNVADYLLLIGRISGFNGKKLKGRVDDTLGMVDLANKAAAKIGTLSRGMLQRLGIAQAILREADFIIMDEPASGLDPLGQKGIRDLITLVNRQGKTILFSSHYLVEIERVCHRVGILHSGSLVLDSSLEELAIKHRGKVEIEIDGESSILEKACSALNLELEKNGHKIVFHNLDDTHYFSLMKILDENRIRLLELKYSGVLLEEVFMAATDLRREKQ